LKSLVITHWTARRTRSYIWLLVKWSDVMDLISDSWWSDEINSYNWLMDEGPEEMIAKSFDSWETRGLEYQNIWIVERREEWSGWRDEGTCLFLLFVCWVRDSCLSCCCLFPEWVSERGLTQVVPFMDLLIVRSILQIYEHFPKYTPLLIQTNYKANFLNLNLKLEGHCCHQNYFMFSPFTLIGRLSPERPGFKSPQ